MPYYRHLKSEDPENGQAFADPSDARKGMDPKTYTVTFVATTAEKAAWQLRERHKYSSGLYLPVPWIADTGSTYMRFDLPDEVSDHYPHLSAKFPGLIAYTKSDEHGVLDRKTAVKPGKYIEEYLKDKFTPDQIADYIARCKSEAFELKIARTEADIVAIYSQKDCGFTSCMQNKHDPEYNWQCATENGDRLHPVAVYGDSDLGVAYLGDIQTKIKARAVVWPDQKRYTRLYGDINTLKHVLRANGYRAGSLIGSRVRRLEGPKGIIMPYIDGLTNASESECGKWIELDNEGPLSCDNTEGYAKQVSDRERPDHDDEDDGDDHYNDEYTCAHCGEDYDYGRQTNGPLNRTWCDDCIDSSTVCQVCNTRRWSQDWERIDGLQTCDSCQAGMTRTCLRSGSSGIAIVHCENEWIEVVEFTRAERETRVTLGVAHLCAVCAEHKQTCTGCGSLFDSTSPACDLCGQTIRCDRTFDLLDFTCSGVPDSLPVGADGSKWWTQAPTTFRYLPVGHWVMFSNGNAKYTPDCGQTYTDSTFDTLDTSQDFVRVADPRRPIVRPYLHEATPFTTYTIAENSPF